MDLSRRQFLAATGALVATASARRAAAQGATAEPVVPWFQRTHRWVQTNLNEQDPASYDAALWADHWKRVRAQGVIVNAGGIVAFYPTSLPWHHRALALGSRDLFGEIATAARQAGLTVLARMDSTRTYEEVFRGHPEWFARDREGRPFKAGDLYTVCVNGPWVDECVPAILREIAERYRPDGFTDNSWSGLGQKQICYCDNCRSAFPRAAGLALPARVDWDDAAYRAWIRWSYERRTQIRDAYDQATRKAGGEACVWLGMCQGDPARMCEDFRHPTAIWSRSPMVMLDWQARRTGEGFQTNAFAGATVNGVLGWRCSVAESTALYLGPTRPMFRKAAKPEPEVRLWAIEGMAAGIQPWWHQLGATQEDRRILHTAERLSQWHAANEEYLVDRTPVATVGLVWSEANIDWYGRGESATRTVLPWTGMAEALTLHRIPWRPVHADEAFREDPGLDVLVLPNLAAMSQAHAEAARRFVAAGGGLVATGESSLYDEQGSRRGDFALAELFGAHAAGAGRGSFDGPDPSPWTSWQGHSYLRLPAAGRRGPALAGFEETAILPFGGQVELVRPDATTIVALTLVPDSPQSPPENVWMREPATDVPALLLQTPAGRGRVAYLAADLDRCYGRDRIPDHARLLANVVRWASPRPLPLEVEGPGLLDCHLYRQQSLRAGRRWNRLVLHVVNLNNTAAFRPYATELFPVGPVRVRVACPADLQPSRVRRLVAGSDCPLRLEDGRVEASLDSVLDHEVLVIE